MTRHQPSRFAFAVATLALLVSVVPAAAAEPEAPAVAPADTGAGVVPTVHHEDALGHASDAITFTPGSRVTVPFKPRATDRWTVGGVAPRALPAGRASGADMAVSPQGSQWSVAGAGEPALDSPTPDTTAADTTGSAATGLFREVFGFLPYWELSDSALDLDYSVLSTIAYFSVGADTAGNLEKRTSTGAATTGWAGWTSSRMTQVINDAHRSGARVVLTITAFAWTTSEANAQKALLGSPTARLNLARQAAAAVRDRGADGINLDFEPIASGYAEEFTALVRSVRSELDAIAPGYQLTFDTTGFIGNYPIEAATAPGGADAIFIMGYDFRTGSSATSGSIAPLKGQVFDVGDAVAQYAARVPASKLILGVPYYGRIWSTASDQPRSTNTSGTRTGASGTAIYTTARTSAAEHGRRWDATEASPWTAYQRENCTPEYGCVTSWRQLWYDDAQSLGLKYDLVNDRGLRGAGIWALGYDNGRTELDEALASRFLHDTRGPVAGINFVPWRQRDAGFVVGWSGRDVSGIASWDVQVSVDGGPWSPWLSGATATTSVYLGQHGQGLAFRVRGTDRKGNVGAWDVSETWEAAPALHVGGFGGVRIDGLQMRSGPSTAAASLGELTTGQIINIVDGPVSAGGHTWWEAVGPLREWRPVGPVSRFWVAQGSTTAPNLVASRVPSSTIVDAVLRDLNVAAEGPGVAGEPPARVVSPNGDGLRDTIAITWTNAVPLESLELRVVRADGSVAGTIPLGTSATAAGARRHDWDGKLGGAALPDGTYVLALAGTAAGVAVTAPSSRPATAEQLARFGVRVDTVGPVLDRSSSTSAVLSPNGDGRLDDVSVAVQASEPSFWVSTVTGLEGPRTGHLVRTATLPTGAWKWDGRDDLGNVVADGRYRVALWARDGAGNVSVRTWSLIVDTTAPAVTTTLTPAVFSPNGDGTFETTAMGWTVAGSTGAAIELLRGTSTIGAWPLAAGATTGSFTWNGRDGAGRTVANGAYVLRLRASDAAGNVSTAARTAVVDRTLARTTWTPALFFPHDGDALARNSTMSFELTGPARTTVRILTQDNRYVRTPWANRDLGAGVHRWTWDGKAATGQLVPRGWYRIVVIARSPVATTSLMKLVLVDAFTATVSSTTPAAGEVLSLDLRSAETLTAAPSVTFTQTGRAPVTKAAVQYATGRYRVAFTVAPGAGPARLSIAGRDTRGGTNRQVVPLTVR